MDIENKNEDRTASMGKTGSAGVARAEDTSMRETTDRNQEVGDQGINQTQAAEILRNLRDRAFDGSNEKLALVLGRPHEEIEAWCEGKGIMDDDVLMKARGISKERGVEISDSRAPSSAR